MADLHNVFISHYGEDEKHLDSLKQRLRDQDARGQVSDMNDG